MRVTVDHVLLVLATTDDLMYGLAHVIDVDGGELAVIFDGHGKAFFLVDERDPVVKDLLAKIEPERGHLA
jgi:hypothetical protein